MAEQVTHFFPDALLIFVRGFQGIPTDISDVTVVSNMQQVKEIESINVSLTVKNSPGTFNVSISNTGNRYTIGDDPTTEIADMYNKSVTQKIRSFTAYDKKA